MVAANGPIWASVREGQWGCVGGIGDVMTFVRGNFSGFKNRPQRRFQRTVYVGKIDMLMTAAKVGMPTLPSNPAAKRSLLEMQWRMAMVAANLELAADGRHWRRTPGYINLDPSEKSAVSYFLGMTQAALMSRIVLGYTHLQHVDLLLKHQQPPRSLGKARRPDLVAEDPLNPGTYTATIEAKGRSNQFDKEALKSAKSQARSLPALNGLAATECIGSEAFFDDAGNWASKMSDPDPAEVEPLSFGLETYMMLYYRNIVDAGRRAPTWERDGDHFTFKVPEFPIAISVPETIVEAYDTSAEIASDSDRDREAIITNTYRDLATVRVDGDVASRDGNEPLILPAAERWDLVRGRLTGDDGDEQMLKLFAPSEDVAEVTP